MIILYLLFVYTTTKHFFLIPKLLKILDICENKKYAIHKIDLLQLPLKLEGIHHPIAKVWWWFEKN